MTSESGRESHEPIGLGAVAEEIGVAEEPIATMAKVCLRLEFGFGVAQWLLLRCL